jgi:hypothetical protein
VAEHPLHMREVAGSNPASSTIDNKLSECYNVEDKLKIKEGEKEMERIEIARKSGPRGFIILKFKETKKEKEAKKRREAVDRIVKRIANRSKQINL